MQSCIWSRRSWPLTACEAVWHAIRLPSGTGAAAAELGYVGAAGVGASVPIALAGRLLVLQPVLN